MADLTLLQPVKRRKPEEEGLYVGRLPKMTARNMEVWRTRVSSRASAERLALLGINPRTGERAWLDADGGVIRYSDALKAKSER